MSKPRLVQYVEFEVDSLTSLEPQKNVKVVGIGGVDAELKKAPHRATHYRTYNKWVGVAPDGRTLMTSEPVNVSERRFVEDDGLRFDIKEFTQIYNLTRKQYLELELDRNKILSTCYEITLNI